MISIKFFGANGVLTGFSASGHGTTDSDDELGRIVCAAVSSAVYLTANTLTEIVGAKADVSDNGNVFKLSLLSESGASQVTLQGLKLHLTELSKDYKNKIKIFSEV